MTFVVAIAACFGVGLLMLAPVLVWLSVKSRRDARWVRRHPVSPAAAVRLGVALPQRYALFGLTAPGPAGTVRTLLDGTPAVWCRTMVYTRRSLGEDRGELRVLFEQTFGEPFGVADSTGTAAVAGNFLEAFLFNGHPPLWRRIRIPEGQPGEQLVHRAVDELTAKRDEPGPYLRAAIERGLVGPGARRRVDEVGVLEEYIAAGQPLHVIGKPAMLDGGVPGLTMPRRGRYLIVSREPAETEAELVGDGRSSLGCGLWVLLIGAVAVAVSFAVAYSAGFLG
ncbi:hypothetical protein ACQPZX_14655 [Actinoplanes sp. CA-142083]|uniref:hypothetical protein n=1 Tax=Actinoplanes sp. CA-142083 TaxID=3239903 RepID=UPI003D91F40A